MKIEQEYSLKRESVFTLDIVGYGLCKSAMIAGYICLYRNLVEVESLTGSYLLVGSNYGILIPSRQAQNRETEALENDGA